MAGLDRDLSFHCCQVAVSLSSLNLKQRSLQPKIGSYKFSEFGAFHAAEECGEEVGQSEKSSTQAGASQSPARLRRRGAISFGKRLSRRGEGTCFDCLDGGFEGLLLQLQCGVSQLHPFQLEFFQQ